MKILIINSVCGIRSTGRICTDLADALIENGNSCMVAYGREEIPEKYKALSYRIGSDMDVKLHALSARLFDNAGFGSKRATLRLIRKIEEFDPDIIHLHNIHGYYINIEVLFNYLKTADKPVIWTLHDCWAFTGHCAYFSASNCDRWKTECHNCPNKKSYPTSLLTDRSRKNHRKKKDLFTGVKNMTLVTPSEWLADLTKESFLKDYPAAVIHNGIDLSVFKPTYGNFRKKYHLQDKKIILGVASVWDERKGFDDFIKLSDLIDEQTYIVLVGVSKKQLKSLPKKIIGIERTNNVGKLAELYTTSDVFVNPTYEDNYPTVNLEAQACQTPVVTYNTGGCAETIAPGCGIVVYGRSIENIKCAVDSVFSGECRPIRNAELYDKKSKCLEYLSLYNKVLAERENDSVCGNRACVRSQE